MARFFDISRAIPYVAFLFNFVPKFWLDSPKKVTVLFSV